MSGVSWACTGAQSMTESMMESSVEQQNFMILWFYGQSCRENNKKC
jgi:hypothetical protein